MEFGINFNEASIAWRSNKKYLGNGMFVYTCNYVFSNGKPCRGTIYSQRPKNKDTNIYSNLEIDKYHNHPNTDIFCKQHLNRKLFPKK
jgi:hypothetical protein